MLAKAMSMNSMLFFLGGSIGTGVLFAFSTSSGLVDGSLNPLHSGSAAGFSDGFLLLMIPVLIALGLSLALPAVSSREISEEEITTPDETIAEAVPVQRWVPNCSVPWHPECVETIPTAVPVEGD